MKALVISGGGSKGAFAGGFAEYLLDVKKNHYDIFVGTSTGSLLVPLLAVGEIDLIKETYTNVSQKDIYNISPFTIWNDSEGNIRSKINHRNTLKMFLKRKKTFGETRNLRKLIESIYSPEIHEKIKSSNKHVVVTVSNLTNQRSEYKYARDYSREDFMDWMWASSSFVPFMSIVEKNGFEYADGGFGNYLPIEEAVNLGATEIDVIVLSPRHNFVHKCNTTNAFEIILQSMQFMLYQLGRHDLLIGHLESIYNKDVKINFHFTPRNLTNHSFYFEPKIMQSWWQEGYDYAASKL